MSTSNGKAGGSYPVPYLIAQARYVVGTAKSDPAMVKAVGSQVLGEFEADVRALESQLAAWGQARQQAKALTMDEQRLAAAAMRWIAAFRHFYRASVHRGQPLPALPKGPPATTQNSTRVALEIGDLLKSGREYAAPLAAVGCASDFLAQGEQLMKQLLAADEKQEVARQSVRAEEHRKLLALKQRVLEAVRSVVSVGRAVYANEPLKAKAYNLRMLRRGHGAAPPDSPPPPSEKVA